MWIVYVLLGLLVPLGGILLVPICGRITYDGERLFIGVKILGIPLWQYAYPKPEEETPTVSTALQKNKKQQPKEEGKTPSKLKELVKLLKEDDVAGTIQFLSQTAQIVGDAANRFVRSVRISRFHLQMRIATDDAAQTAQRYGQVCSVVYPAIAAIESAMRVRRRRVRIEPNFLLEQSAVRADIRLWMPLWRLPGTWGSLLWRFLELK